jgi:uncharacterized membrane protein
MQRVASSVRDGASQEQVRRADPLSTRAIIAADRAIYRFAHHWLFDFNGVSGGFAGAVIAAPLLAAWDKAGAAKPLYSLFSLVCHQDPDRSFHIFGHQFACCERCAAIYLSIALFGVLFAFVRARMSNPTYVAMIALVSPVVLDGMAVGSGLYGGNLVMRVVTGTLFGFAVIWFLYPRFEAGFAGLRAQLESLFDRLVSQGRAKPLTS